MFLSEEGLPLVTTTGNEDDGELLLSKKIPK